MSAQGTVDRCNELARLFCEAHGYQVEKGYDFSAATHPQERSMWNLAVIAFYYIEDTDVDAALDEVEDS